MSPATPRRPILRDAKEECIEVYYLEVVEDDDPMTAIPTHCPSEEKRLYRVKEKEDIFHGEDFPLPPVKESQDNFVFDSPLFESGDKSKPTGRRASIGIAPTFMENDLIDFMHIYHNVSDESQPKSSNPLRVVPDAMESEDDFIVPFPTASEDLVAGFRFDRALIPHEDLQEVQDLYAERAEFHFDSPGYSSPSAIYPPSLPHHHLAFEDAYHCRDDNLLGLTTNAHFNKRLVEVGGGNSSGYAIDALYLTRADLPNALVQNPISHPIRADVPSRMPHPTLSLTSVYSKEAPAASSRQFNPLSSNKPSSPFLELKVNPSSRDEAMDIDYFTPYKERDFSSGNPASRSKSGGAVSKATADSSRTYDSLADAYQSPVDRVQFTSNVSHLRRNVQVQPSRTNHTLPSKWSPFLSFLGISMQSEPKLSTRKVAEVEDAIPVVDFGTIYPDKCIVSNPTSSSSFSSPVEEAKGLKQTTPLMAAVFPYRSHSGSGIHPQKPSSFETQRMNLKMQPESLQRLENKPPSRLLLNDYSVVARSEEVISNRDKFLQIKQFFENFASKSSSEVTLPPKSIRR